MSQDVTYQDLIDALGWVIPMAKGWAFEHPVGNNLGIVLGAEDILGLAREVAARTEVATA